MEGEREGKRSEVSTGLGLRAVEGKGLVAVQSEVRV